jgi:ABC-type nitrate/sulfonate/bicarbonate transport system permease component
VGFGLAVAIGVPLGLLMGTTRGVYRLLEPITELVRPIPSSAYIPVAILFLGLGDQMKVFVITLACLFPVLLNTYSGVKAIDPVLVDTGRTFGVSRTDVLRKIVLPATLPSILTGMRISLGIALIVSVVAEMISGNSGMGYFIMDKQRTFRVPDVFAGIFTLGVVGYLLNAGFLQVERHLLRWRSSDVQL